jgi:DNA-binding NarL/FixJ family response regulator
MSTKSISVVYYHNYVQGQDPISIFLDREPGITLIQACKFWDQLEDVISNDQPDVVVLNVDLQVDLWIKRISIIKSMHFKAKVILISDIKDISFILSAIEQGVDAYLLRNTVEEDILKAIRDVYAEGAVLSPIFAKKLFQCFQHQMGVDFGLTNREEQIMNGLIKGYSYKMIAFDMGIKLDTVRSHIRKVYAKLDVNSRTEAILKVMNVNGHLPMQSNVVRRMVAS